MNTLKSSGSMLGVAKSELIKLFSVRVPWVAVGLAVVAMALFALVFGRVSWLNEHPIQPVGYAPINMLVFVQYAVVVLALQAITTEYANGSISTTLLTVPNRTRLLLAKAIVVGSVAFTLGLVLGVVGMATSWTQFHGRATFDGGTVLFHLVAMGTYAALIGLITLGIGATVRSAIGAFAIALILFTIVPWMLDGLGGDLLLTISDLLPQSAGGNFMLARNDRYPTGVAALITCAWAAASLLCGLTALIRRDT